MEAGPLLMWIKPPEWNHHVCDKPPLDDRVQSEGHARRYQNCIWRCDDCLSVYILKLVDDQQNRQWLLWRSYDFTTG